MSIHTEDYNDAEDPLEHVHNEEVWQISLHATEATARTDADTLRRERWSRTPPARPPPDQSHNYGRSSQRTRLCLPCVTMWQ